ncbi:MAG: Gfo/Idh/MocA family oxidoreductase [Planctomycetes bacterium]|nr:Gfo/Idh/MocA family oxidoreductase [Planctomycetota bacterium]
MSKRQKNMRVVMVGVGGFGYYRRDRMRETGLFDIVAAYDRNPQALKACADQDGAKPASSFEELLDTPDVEALVISTGATFHAAQALAGMKRGLHIFMEKPLCSTEAEVRSLLAMQRKTGVVVGVGHNDHAHDPASLKLREMLAGGYFGTTATFEMVTAHSGGLEISPGDWRGDPKKNPGGMLFQCGVHALHKLLFLFGPIQDISAVMRYDVHSTKTADVAHCLLRFRSGMVGTLSAYHVTPYRHTFHIYGTERSLFIDGRAPAYGDPSIIRTQVRRNCKAELLKPCTLGRGHADLCGGLKSFHHAVRTGGEPSPSLKDGARAVLAVFAAERSAKTGRRVAVPVL